jgi:hypothetical protein
MTAGAGQAVSAMLRGLDLAAARAETAALLVAAKERPSQGDGRAIPRAAALG